MGFKLRLGWDSSHEVYRELSRELASMGAGWITLHPRHAVQGFAGTPRFEAIGELAAELPVPVIASGDLFTAADGIRVLRETGCASVMYARGALKNPAIFARHLELLRGEGEPAEAFVPEYGEGPLSAQDACDVLDAMPVDRDELAAVIRRHAQLARRWSPHLALLKMRTFVPRYVKSMDGARALRQEIVKCTDWETLNSVLEKYFGAELETEL
jgi:tRNA-dihydrouridine synthase B